MRFAAMNMQGVLSHVGNTLFGAVCEAGNTINF